MFRVPSHLGVAVAGICLGHAFDPDKALSYCSSPESPSDPDSFKRRYIVPTLKERFYWKKETEEPCLTEQKGPRRILSLDGGGVRGILGLGILEQLEHVLRLRHGNDAGFRLCHYFDLIAGTSTGAIIAAALAKGESVTYIKEKYDELGQQVFFGNGCIGFRRRVWRNGFFAPKFSSKRIQEQLREEFKEADGQPMQMQSGKLEAGLLIVTKRMDTGSVWPLNNNPSGAYWEERAGDSYANNKAFPLYKVIRASTAAPTYFKAEKINLQAEGVDPPIVATFADGGVSPFNNPALQAFMYATLKGYNVNWRTGQDNLLLVSVGTGAADPRSPKTRFSKLAGLVGVNALMQLMNDCSRLQDRMLRWLGHVPDEAGWCNRRPVDGEIGNLCDDALGGAPLLTYLRYDVDLYMHDQKPEQRKEVQDIAEACGLDLTDPDKKLKSLRAMDKPCNMPDLHKLGVAAGHRYVKREHFSEAFDLKKRLAPPSGLANMPQDGRANHDEPEGPPATLPASGAGPNCTQ